MPGHGLVAGRAARYIGMMDTVFVILVGLAMAATLVALFAGILTMAKGGNPRASNRLMQSRVLLQGLAIALFAILMLAFKN